MSRPQNSFWIFSQPPISPIGPQKVKNDPKMKSNSKVGFEEILENEKSSTTWVDHKIVFQPYTDSKNSPLEARNSKKDSQIKSK